MGDSANSVLPTDGDVEPAPGPAVRPPATPKKGKGSSSRGDMAWPSWAKCVGCYKKTFEGRRSEAREKKIVEFYESKDFLSLPCAHVVCSTDCLKRCRRPVGNEKEGNIREEVKSRCTECEGEFVEAMVLETKTIRPLEVTGRTAQQTTRLNKKCQACIRPNALAERYCEECALVLCQRCIDHHTVRNDTARHSLIISPRVFYIVPKSEVCSGHPNYRLEAFCSTCDLQLCPMCISEGTHAQHKTCNLKELAQKTVKELETLSLDHSKMVNGMKTAKENFRRKLETLKERCNKIQTDASWDFENAAGLISEQQVDLKEDIVLAVTVQAYKMNLRNTCYKSLISQAEVLGLFDNIFDFVNFPKNKSKFELIHKFYSLIKEQLKYAETITSKLREEPVEEIQLENNSKATLDALDNICRLELLTSSPIPSMSEESESEDANLIVLESSSSTLDDTALLAAGPSSNLTPSTLARPTWGETNICRPPLPPTNNFPSFSDEVALEIEVTSSASHEFQPVPLPTQEDIVTSSPSNIANAAGETLLSKQLGRRSSLRRTVSDSPESDQDDDVQRCAFFCDDEDSSDEDQTKVKTEPMDYEDRDEEPPDDDDSQHDIPVFIKKEIDYDMFREQYDSANGNESETLIPLEFQNGSIVTTPRHQPETFPLAKMLSGGVLSGEQPDKSITPENSDTSSLPESGSTRLRGRTLNYRDESTAPNIPQTENVLPIENNTMISSQRDKEKVSAALFDDEFILPSPLSDTAGSDDEFFKDVHSELANSPEQDESEPDEVLDPQTGLLIRKEDLVKEQEHNTESQVSINDSAVPVQTQMDIPTLANAVKHPDIITVEEIIPNTVAVNSLINVGDAATPVVEILLELAKGSRLISLAAPSIPPTTCSPVTTNMISHNAASKDTDVDQNSAKNSTCAPAPKHVQSASDNTMDSNSGENVPAVKSQGPVTSSSTSQKDNQTKQVSPSTPYTVTSDLLKFAQVRGQENEKPVNSSERVDFIIVDPLCVNVSQLSPAIQENARSNSLKKSPAPGQVLENMISTLYKKAEIDKGSPALRLFPNDTQDKLIPNKINNTEIQGVDGTTPMRIIEPTKSTDGKAVPMQNSAASTSFLKECLVSHGEKINDVRGKSNQIQQRKDIPPKTSFGGTASRERLLSTASKSNATPTKTNPSASETKSIPIRILPGVLTKVALQSETQSSPVTQNSVAPYSTTRVVRLTQNDKQVPSTLPSAIPTATEAATIPEPNLQARTTNNVKAVATIASRLRPRSKSPKKVSNTEPEILETSKSFPVKKINRPTVSKSSVEIQTDGPSAFPPKATPGQMHPTVTQSPTVAISQVQIVEQPTIHSKPPPPQLYPRNQMVNEVTRKLIILNKPVGHLPADKTTKPVILNKPADQSPAEKTTKLVILDKPLAPSPAEKKSDCELSKPTQDKAQRVSVIIPPKSKETGQNQTVDTNKQNADKPARPNVVESTIESLAKPTNLDMRSVVDKVREIRGREMMEESIILPSGVTISRVPNSSTNAVKSPNVNAFSIGGKKLTDPASVQRIFKNSQPEPPVVEHFPPPTITRESPLPITSSKTTADEHGKQTGNLRQSQGPASAIPVKPRNIVVAKPLMFETASQMLQKRDRVQTPGGPGIVNYSQQNSVENGPKFRNLPIVREGTGMTRCPELDSPQTPVLSDYDASIVSLLTPKNTNETVVSAKPSSRLEFRNSPPKLTPMPPPTSKQRRKRSTLNSPEIHTSPPRLIPSTNVPKEDELQKEEEERKRQEAKDTERQEERAKKTKQRKSANQLFQKCPPVIHKVSAAPHKDSETSVTPISVTLSTSTEATPSFSLRRLTNVDPPIANKETPGKEKPLKKRKRNQSLGRKDADEDSVDSVDNDPHDESYQPNFKKSRMKAFMEEQETKRSQRERKKVVYDGCVDSEETIKNIMEDEKRERKQLPIEPKRVRIPKSDRISSRPRTSLELKESEAEPQSGQIQKPVRTYPSKICGKSSTSMDEMGLSLSDDSSQKSTDNIDMVVAGTPEIENIQLQKDTIATPNAESTDNKKSSDSISRSNDPAVDKSDVRPSAKSRFPILTSSDSANKSVPPKKRMRYPSMPSNSNSSEDNDNSTNLVGIDKVLKSTDNQIQPSDMESIASEIFVPNVSKQLESLMEASTQSNLETTTSKPGSTIAEEKKQPIDGAKKSSLTKEVMENNDLSYAAVVKQNTEKNKTENLPVDPVSSVKDFDREEPSSLTKNTISTSTNYENLNETLNKTAFDNADGPKLRTPDKDDEESPKDVVIKRKRGRPFGWRKQPGAIWGQSKKSSPNKTLKSSTNEKPITSEEVVTRPIIKKEMGDGSEFEFNSDDEVAPPPKTPEPQESHMCRRSSRRSVERSSSSLGNYSPDSRPSSRTDSERGSVWTSKLIVRSRSRSTESLPRITRKQSSPFNKSISESPKIILTRKNSTSTSPSTSRSPTNHHHSRSPSKGSPRTPKQDKDVGSFGGSEPGSGSRGRPRGRPPNMPHRSRGRPRKLVDAQSMKYIDFNTELKKGGL